jgi:hypothetical protein
VRPRRTLPACPPAPQNQNNPRRSAADNFSNLSRIEQPPRSPRSMMTGPSRARLRRVAAMALPVCERLGAPTSTGAGKQHARHTKPGPAMHGLRFSDEVDGDRAERGGPGSANLYLPTVQKAAAAPDRQCCDRGLAGAKTVRKQDRRRRDGPVGQPHRIILSQRLARRSLLLRFAAAE